MSAILDRKKQKGNLLPQEMIVKFSKILGLKTIPDDFLSQKWFDDKKNEKLHRLLVSKEALKVSLEYLEKDEKEERISKNGVLSKRFNIIKSVEEEGIVKVWGFDSYPELKKAKKTPWLSGIPFDGEYLDTKKGAKDSREFTWTGKKLKSNFAIIELVNSKNKEIINSINKFSRLQEKAKKQEEHWASLGLIILDDKESEEVKEEIKSSTREFSLEKATSKYTPSQISEIEELMKVKQVKDNFLTADWFRRPSGEEILFNVSDDFGLEIFNKDNKKINHEFHSDKIKALIKILDPVKEVLHENKDVPQVVIKDNNIYITGGNLENYRVYIDEGAKSIDVIDSDMKRKKEIKSEAKLNEPSKETINKSSVIHFLSKFAPNKEAIPELFEAMMASERLAKSNPKKFKDELAKLQSPKASKAKGLTP